MKCGIGESLTAPPLMPRPTCPLDAPPPPQVPAKPQKATLGPQFLLEQRLLINDVEHADDHADDQ
jgi:hypothetical protein